LLSAELPRFAIDVDDCSPIKMVLAHCARHVAIPALPVSVAMLTALPEKSRQDNRVLALLAQKDPVFLTRLLCLAAQPEVTRGKRYARNAEEAIELIGTASTLNAMLEIVQIGAPVIAADRARHTAMQFVARRCLAYALTARRLSAYLELDDASASRLLLAALLDNLGLFVAIHADCEESALIQGELADRYDKGDGTDYILRQSPLLRDYSLLAVQLGRTWQVPTDILDILESSKNPLHCLLLAVERMIDAKRRKVSQQQALLELIRIYPDWAARLRPGEIDLAVLR
jgi:HD-like signal output (HDOD) protein